MDLADPNLVKAIWKPEVFFPNAKEANFQFVTVPNVLIRIHPNGEILYILRQARIKRSPSRSNLYRHDIANLLPMQFSRTDAPHTCGGPIFGGRTEREKGSSAASPRKVLS